MWLANGQVIPGLTTFPIEQKGQTYRLSRNLFLYVDGEGFLILELGVDVKVPGW